MYRRTVIRNAIVTLVTGLATTGANVTVGRIYPDEIGGLPSLNIVTGAEEVAEGERVLIEETASPWPQNRAVAFEIECRASGDAIDDQLDQIALEVEIALNADATLSGECDKLEYTGSSETTYADELETGVGMRALQYVAMFRVNARDPQALED